MQLRWLLRAALGPVHHRAVLPLSLTSPVSLLIGGVALGAMPLIAWLRRPALPKATAILAFAGAMALLLGAAGITWASHPTRNIVVRVDLSPSTRIAGYRQRDQIERRLRQLLGQAPYTLECFADGPVPSPQGDKHWLDARVDRTTYPPPDAHADAVLLFTDARFPLPSAGPPTYPIIDPLLEDVPDSSVKTIQLDNVAARVDVTADDAKRVLTFSQDRNAERSRPLHRGTQSFGARLLPGATLIAARLSPGDAWPENDELSAFVAPSPQAEQWWVADGPPPSSAWRTFPPSALPAEAPAYLAPSIVVLNNVDADALDAHQQRLLLQYVRDLGGSLLIIGGDHAFAPGHYTGSTLETLGPLASTPPTPVLHWMLLVDASGSMQDIAEEPSGASRWRLASEALARLLPQLPPADLISVGMFSSKATWWSTGKSAHDTAAMALPPASASPHGPTNLEPVLEQIARDGTGSMPTELLIVSDADAELDHPAALADALRAKRIRLHLLAMRDGSALAALTTMARTTGGSVIRELDPKQWTQATQKLLRTSLPPRLETAPATAHYSGLLATLPDRVIQPWNHTWLKPNAELLAAATGATPAPPLAAMWQSGSGRVLSAAFANPDLRELNAMVHLIARAPADPRYRVTCDGAERLHVSIDAVAPPHGYINNASITLSLHDADSLSPVRGTSIAIPQVAPGRYELATDAPRQASFAAVDVSGHTIARFAVAGRYPPEFDALGNDHAAMQEIARRTGGQVIPPNQFDPIDLQGTPHLISLTPWFAILGTLLIAGAVGYWRLQ